MHHPTRTVTLLALLVGAMGCDQPNPRPPLAKDRLAPTLPFTGIVPCAHPMPKRVAFDEPTALGVSAQEAFAEISGKCSAPFVWQTREETEISVEVVLDEKSAVEVSYPVTDTCVDHELTVQGNIVLSTADGELSIRGRSTFEYTSSISGAIHSAAELVVPAKAVSATEGQYVVRVGGGGAACAGEIRRKGRAESRGTWSANGCPLNETPIEPDSSPELTVRMQLLDKAWHDAQLDAAWETGDNTQLELDVERSSAPICQSAHRRVTVPVEVRYGTTDGVVPVHDAPGTVSFSLDSDKASLQLALEEETQCSALAAPVPGYCENLSTAKLRVSAAYPNTPTQRITRLIVDGTPIGSDPSASTQRVLHAAGAPHALECLFTFDCPIDEVCDDGFCRGRPKGQ